MRPMIEYQLGGILLRYKKDLSHRRILFQIDRTDAHLVKGIGWTIKNPEKYQHIPEIAAVMKDYQSQMILPGVGSPREISS